jgi:uncharacterized SAM-binding protein YcdF (DUF218 family)
MGLSNNGISNALLRPLEHRYPPLVVARPGPSPLAVGYIAVLGGWADDDPDVPITSHLSPALMVRLIEGVRWHRQIPGSRLILSGSSYSAEGMSEMAAALGVRPEDILRLSSPRDTEEESQEIQSIVGHQPFILVTSAAHMPRAQALFRKKGLQSIPAPTDYLSPRHPTEIDDVVPDAYKLYKSQTAFYEYLGRAWASLRGAI